MLKIGDFSRLARVSVKTLRHYGRLGLLKPAWIDRFTGYRYYALEQLPQLNRILALKDLGFSLEQIQDMLRDDIPAAELRGMLKLKHAELQRRVLDEQARLARVEARLRQIEREGALPEYEVALKQVDPQLVIGIRSTVPSYAQVGQLFAELYAYLRSQGIAPETAYPAIAIHYDTEYRERGIDVEAAAPIPHPVADTSRAVVHDLRGAPTMACVIHQGSHESLSVAYNSLTAWTQTNGYRIVAPNREIYLQGAEPGVDPEEYVTEIQLPVEHVLADLSEREKERPMEPKIVTKPAFTVVGMRYFGKNENNEIAAMWDQLNPRWHEFKNQASGNAYGLCFAANEEGEFEYVGGVDVTDTSHIPQGMVAREVPPAKYAVFPTTLKTIRETYDHAFHTWLPQSGYEWAKSPDFELYDETFDPTDPASELYIYIPIK
jgi:predicted transcriptional regulator YdeE